MNYFSLFKEAVGKFADKVALVDGRAHSLTYTELYALTGKVAAKLFSLGVRHGDFVAINMPRVIEYQAAYLGILRAGAVIVPLVPDYPEERINFITNDCGAKLTVTEEFFSDIDSFGQYENPADGSEPAILIYTSGSTGTPKGILESTADIARAVKRQLVFGDGVDDIRLAACASFSFAAHIFEYQTWYLRGATLFVVPDEVRKSAVMLEKFYRDNDINMGFISPQILKLFRFEKDKRYSIITGSERLSNIEYRDNVRVLNIYGMSETILVSVFVMDKTYSNTPLGKALDGITLTVVDDDGNALPDGAEGEICITGMFDSRYYKDEEKTAYTMRPNPDGTTTVHTGDNGYFNENGDLVFVNRRDWMVKINGQRVETGEIEIIIGGIDGIESAAVKAFTDGAGQTYIAAYYSLKNGAEVRENEVRTALSAKLPDYMMPRFFVKMDALPKNLSGKLDKTALPSPKAEDYKAEYAAPTTESEEKLCSAFEAVLECGKVGIYDDFFALGGDSIKVLKLIAAAEIDELEPSTVLAGKTPHAVADMLSGSFGLKARHSETIPEVTPLSKAQKGVYLECAENPDSTMYNIPMLCRLPSSVDVDRFAYAVKTAAENHEAFFVTVCTPDGTPAMIYKKTSVEVEVKNVRSIEDEVKSFVRPFDLEHGPLYRFEVITDGESKALLFDIHHIIFDGTSAEALIKQIADVYSGCAPKPEELTQFDVSALDAECEETDAYRAAEKFFDEMLAGIDCDSRIISDVVTEETPDGIGSVGLSSDGIFTSDEVRSFTRANRITENTLFLGAFAYALSRFNGTDDALFCTVDNGRHDARLSGSVGMFVKTLPLYFNFTGSESVSDCLPSVQDKFYRAMSHDMIDFGTLASKYGVGTETMFIYQAELFNGAPVEDGRIGVEMLETGDLQCDIDVMLMKTSDGYELSAHYRRKLYSESLVRSFCNMFLGVVKGMLSSSSLGDIPLCDGENRALIDLFNKTEYPYEDKKTVVELFREQAAKTPDKICLVYEENRYTYRYIDEITDTIAKYLVKNGIGRKKVVGVLIPRSEYMLICSLAVLKAGGAYLPLDPSYPPERLNLMIGDSRAAAVIYADALDGIITEEYTGQRIPLSSLDSLEESDVTLRDIQLPTPGLHDLFVMIYTSGSTGVPKGVMFEHGNTVVTTEWEKKFYGIGTDSRVAAYASYGFDANVYDMYPAVTSGAELHIISDEIRLDFPALAEYFNKNGITHTVMTMQVGRQFAEMGGLSTLRHLTVAGEKLIPLDVPEGFAFHNAYGPSEGSVITSIFTLDGRYRDVPIGKAVDNLKAYVVGKGGALLPVGAVGELWIAGPHVTRGYLNRPEKTAEAYGTNPFDDCEGYERVYRTGDIVRYMGDGNLQFVGRRDAQVKVRGFRVELTEVEEVVRRFPGVKDATVAAFDDPAGGKFIAAYVVSDGEIDVRALGDFIRAEKPPYMVPAVTMRIDKIPLNQNQKVNRRALPVPERRSSDMTAPENGSQQKIYDIIAEVIGHKAFGIESDIYDAGLTSIGAVKLNVMLSKAFPCVIKIADIKENPTVRLLEKFVSSAEKAEEYEIFPDYPITETQKGIFIECLSNSDSVLYNMPLLIKLDESVDSEKLASAVKTALDAHPYVKTVLFTDNEGNVRAKRNDGAEIEVPVIKCACLPDSSALVKPFNLLGEPLIRAAIYETDGGKYFFTDAHHIISDGTSESIILSDITKAYVGEEVEKETYTGFEAALDEEQARKTDRLARAKEYYDSIFRGADAECLPGKCPETVEKEAGSIKKVCSVDNEKIKKYCREHGVTANSFWNSVFAYVLARFIHREDTVFTTIYNGRSDSRLAGSVTMLVKTVPVYAKINGGDAPEKLIRDTQTELLGNMSNDLLSFAEVSGAYGIRSDIIFVYQGETFAFDSLCGKTAEVIDVAPSVAKSPISMNVYIRAGKPVIVADYRRDMFCRRLVESLISSVDAVAENFMTAEKLSSVSMMSHDAEETYSVLNASDVKTTGKRVHRVIKEQAALHPDRTAVVAAGESLTFGELNSQANAVANSLVSLGVVKDDIVGLVLERTKEVMICEIGLQKSGGAFLPMLPSYPDERIDYCLTNASAKFVITTENIKAAKPDLFADTKPYRTLTVEELLENNNRENPNVDVQPDALAYCIYTSGSTGTPKGVMIEHRNFSNFVETDQLVLRFFTDGKDGGASLAVSSISFDMSLYEIYLALYRGKTVVMATEDEIHNPIALAKLMKDNDVRFMTCTPSFLNNAISVKEFEEAIRGLTTIVSGAEAFPPSLYDSLKKTSSELQIVNGYGPTETSICCSMKELHSGNGITIGRPTGNVRFYVTDTDGNILPPYASGELMICGEGVGRGYVKLPEKTAAAFTELRGLRAYHSGDLVRVNRDAEIEFSGRLDNQVKLRGFRVELDEIEKVICSFGTVKQAKVVVRNNGGEDYLAAFFTASEPTDIDALTEHLKERLTYYMVPAVIMQLDAIPLTPNGKIDKKALPETANIKKKSADKRGRRAAKKSLEERLCEIFSSVLSLDEVYADDNFFENGGTSLSASKVTMMLMSDGIDVKYGDIFDNPTPEMLAGFIEERDGKAKKAKQDDDSADGNISSKTRDALKYNTVKYAADVKREPLGNVLLTGAVGFLGIHVLEELIKSEKGHIYCLVRRGEYDSPLARLKTMLIYYFSDAFEDALRDRITLIEADITDSSLGDTLADVPFDTVINCAACVKHFSDSDILKRINVGGVKNLISICEKRGARLVQISTVSVPGIHTVESYEKQIRMHENELFVIDDMDNKYAISKYNAELCMFEAIERGMRGRVIRVGNLMGRHRDGEFQANLETNMFLSGIRGFSVMGKYPISHMTDPMRFSPVDCTARAVVLLAGVDDRFTAFNADNRYGFDEMKIIDACNRNGITIIAEQDDVYYDEFRKKLGDDRFNAKLGGLAAYDIKDAHAVDCDNRFTTNVLYRIGFSWPLVDDAYLDRAINSIMTLDYFDINELGDEQ